MSWDFKKGSILYIIITIIGYILQTEYKIPGIFQVTFTLKSANRKHSANKAR